MLPLKLGLKTRRRTRQAGEVCGVGNVPTNPLRMPVRFVNAVENVVGTAVAKSTLPVGSACNAAKRLVGLVDVVPVVPVVVPKIEL